MPSFVLGTSTSTYLAILTALIWILFANLMAGQGQPIMRMSANRTVNVNPYLHNIIAVKLGRRIGTSGTFRLLNRVYRDWICVILCSGRLKLYRYQLSFV